MPRTSVLWLRASMVTALMTPLIPGAGPPPTSRASRPFVDALLMSVLGEWHGRVVLQSMLGGRPSLVRRGRPRDNASMSDSTELKRAVLAQHLRRHVEGEVRFDPTSRRLYSTDGSIYHVEPLGVVVPRSADD